VTTAKNCSISSCTWSVRKTSRSATSPVVVVWSPATSRNERRSTRFISSSCHRRPGVSSSIPTSPTTLCVSLCVFRLFKIYELLDILGFAAILLQCSPALLGAALTPMNSSLHFVWKKIDSWGFKKSSSRNTCDCIEKTIKVGAGLQQGWNHKIISEANDTTDILQTFR